MQHKLIEARLLAPLPGHPLGDKRHNDPLLCILGAAGYRTRTPEPMVWLGKINQLHYLIDTLYRAQVIQCEHGKKWEVAAPLFVNSTEGRPYTAKQLNNAARLSKEDEERVAACIPAKWRK